jgi:hypothetical protein
MRLDLTQTGYGTVKCKMLQATAMVISLLGFFSKGAAITCGGYDFEDFASSTCHEFNPNNNR